MHIQTSSGNIYSYLRQTNEIVEVDIKQIFEIMLAPVSVFTENIHIPNILSVMQNISIVTHFLIKPCVASYYNLTQL